MHHLCGLGSPVLDLTLREIKNDKPPAPPVRRLVHAPKALLLSLAKLFL